MKKLFILLSVLLVLGSACNKDFLNVDEKNPNAASSVPANLVLPAALNSFAAYYDNPDNYSFVYLWYGMWCIQNGYVQPANLTGYNLLNTSYSNNWYYSYMVLQNLDYVEQASTAKKACNFRAISMIMKALIFQNLVDTYGNVPYSEALKSTQGILHPKYDPQKTIYEDLVVKLDTAMKLIANAPVDADAVGTSDIIYQGDMTLWAKFANTVKLRILVNQSGMAGRATYISTNLATTASVGYIGVGEGAMANPGYLKSTNKMNPFYENFYKQDGSLQADALGYFGAGQDACNFLITNNDPRRLRFFSLPQTGANIKGNVFGALALITVPETSKLGPGLLGAFNSDAPVLTDFESLFLQAEAVQRGLLTTGNAQALYESAVTQSVVYMGGTAASATTYLAQVGNQKTNWDAVPDAGKVELIITQKWCALNGISPMPIWTDYRRTGFPKGDIPSASACIIHWTADPYRKSDAPPVRLLYPQSEISTNNDNVLLQGTISLTDSKIFWQNR
jgi:hypothetical protein